MPIATPEVYAEMLGRAKEHSFAFPAINCVGSESINAALKGFADAGSDGIIQFSTGGAEFASGLGVKDMVTGAVALAGTVLATLAGMGIEVLDQRPFLSPWMMGVGTLTSREPAPGEWEEIRAGFALARRLAGSGMKVAIVERDQRHDRGKILARDPGDDGLLLLRRDWKRHGQQCGQCETRGDPDAARGRQRLS